MRYVAAQLRQVRPSRRRGVASEGPAEPDYYDWALPESRTSIEVDDLQPEFTGLYDEHGDPIYRVSEPIGF